MYLETKLRLENRTIRVDPAIKLSSQTSSVNGNSENEGINTNIYTGNYS